MPDQTLAENPISESFEKKEPNKPLFSRDFAFKRTALGLVKLNISLPNQELETLRSGESVRIENQGNILELHHSDDNWYPLVYDNETEYHYYIGVDGEPLQVRSDIFDRLEIEPGVDSSLIFDEDLKGNSATIHNQVVRLTNAAVKKLFMIQDYFEPSFKGELASLKNVENLTIDQYIELMKRLSGHFATHVSRLGVREITSGFHGAGKGKYFSAAHEMLKEGSLASPYMVYKNGTSTGEIYSDEGIEAETKSRTVHVAPELVDLNYAAEVDNYPFVFFPAETLFMNKTFSSRFAFNPAEFGGWANWEVSGTNPDSLSPSNQIGLNLGIVFLPKSTPVDPETGSKFETENGQGVIYEHRVDSLRHLLDDSIAFPEEFQPIREKYYASLSSNFRYERDEAKENYEKVLDKLYTGTGFDQNLAFSQREKIADSIDSWKRELKLIERDFKEKEQENGNKQLPVSVLNWLESDEDWANISFERAKECFLRDCLFQAFALYKPAENTIPAQKYWETWFEKHPKAQPARVIYYDGDPNQSIWKFLLNNKIIIEDDLEFPTFSNEPSRLKRRVNKPKIPSNTSVDIGVFRLHEWGNWMYRLAETK